MYDVSKLAVHILKNHKSDLEMLDCKTMPELVNALKDVAVADTAILLFGLDKTDFLTNDSSPLEVRGIKKAEPKEEEVIVPKIFDTQNVRKRRLVNITKLVELWIMQNNPVNLPEGLNVELQEGFLHLNKEAKLDCEQFLKIDETVIDGNFFITKEGHKPIKNNIFGGYGTDKAYYKKAWLKMYLLVGYIGELLAMSEKIKMGITNIVSQCGEDLDKNFLDDITSLISNAFEIQYKDMTQEERNHHSLTIFTDMFYMSKVKGQKTPDNLYGGYSNCSFIGGGDNDENKALDCDDEFLASCLNSEISEKQVTKPKPKPQPPKPQPPVFTSPEGTDKIVTILTDNEYEAVMPTNQNELTKLRSVTHECLAYYNTLRGKAKPIDEIKLIEDWLAK